MTRPPESRSTPKGTPICSFTVASNRYYRTGTDKQNEVSYFDVEAWSGLAERCAGNLDKGRGVRVVGRLKQDRWTDDEGKSKSHIKIVAEHVEFKPQIRGANSGDGGSEEDADQESSEKEEDLIL